MIYPHQEMVENMPDIVRPVQKQFKKYLSKQKHRNISSELKVKYFEIVVQHYNCLRYCKWELAFKDNLHSLIEIVIVESRGYFSVLLAQNSKYLASE